MTAFIRSCQIRAPEEFTMETDGYVGRSPSRNGLYRVSLEIDCDSYFLDILRQIFEGGFDRYYPPQRRALPETTLMLPPGPIDGVLEDDDGPSPPRSRGPKKLKAS